MLFNVIFRTNKNFTTDVGESNRHGHMFSKTTASCAARIWETLSGLVEPYRVVHLCEIYSKPRLFIRPLLIFKGAYETTSLSWFFCVMTKEQEKKEYLAKVRWYGDMLVL